MRPMGMERADYPFTDANRPLLAVAYNGNPPKTVGYPFIYLRPAGDLKASPDELAALAQFLLRRGKTREGQLVKPESILGMETPETTLVAKNGLRLGYGHCNYSSVEGGVVTQARGNPLERAQQPHHAFYSNRSALTLSVFHADFSSFCARLAISQARRRHEGRASPLRPRGAAACNAGVLDRAL